MATLDEIRAEIVARRDKAQRIVDREIGERDQAAAELLAHDRAVALFAPVAPSARRDIAALVLARQTDEPQTVDDLAKAIATQTRQVADALGRLRSSNKADETPLGWVRVSGLELGDAR